MQTPQHDGEQLTLADLCLAIEEGRLPAQRAEDAYEVSGAALRRLRREERALDTAYLLPRITETPAAEQQEPGPAN